MVRMMSVQSLSQLSGAGTNEISAIRGACLDRDRSVRNAATNALKRISF